MVLGSQRAMKPILLLSYPSILHSSPFTHHYEQPYNRLHLHRCSTFILLESNPPKCCTLTSMETVNSTLRTSEVIFPWHYSSPWMIAFHTFLQMISSFLCLIFFSAQELHFALEQFDDKGCKVIQSLPKSWKNVSPRSRNEIRNAHQEQTEFFAV